MANILVVAAASLVYNVAVYFSDFFLERPKCRLKHCDEGVQAIEPTGHVGVFVVIFVDALVVSTIVVALLDFDELPLPVPVDLDVYIRATDAQRAWRQAWS